MKSLKTILTILIILLIVTCSVVTVSAGKGIGEDVYSDYIKKYEAIISDSGDKKVSVEEFFEIETDGEETSEETNDYLAQFWEAVPESVRNDMPSIDEYGSFYEIYDFNYFTDKIVKAFSEVFPLYRRSLLSILGILLVSGIAGKFSEGRPPGSKEALNIISCASLGICVLNTGVFKTGSIEFFINSVSEFSTAVIPTVTALLAATGNLSSAVLTGQSLTVVCSFIELLFSKIVFPLLSASVATCLAGAVVSSDEVFSISSLFRRSAVFITVFSMTVLVFIVAVQNKLSVAADGIGLKTVKFAVGNFVPFVGGAVSETLNTVGSGLGYVKNTCGALSLVVLFILLLSPIASLIMGKTVCLISSAAANLLGCTTEFKLFSELSAVFNSLIALVVSASTVFIYILIFVINCAVRIGGF